MAPLGPALASSRIIISDISIYMYIHTTYYMIGLSVNKAIAKADSPVHIDRENNK